MVNEGRTGIVVIEGGKFVLRGGRGGAVLGGDVVNQS